MNFLFSELPSFLVSVDTFFLLFTVLPWTKQSNMHSELHLYFAPSAVPTPGPYVGLITPECPLRKHDPDEDQCGAINFQLSYSYLHP